MDRQQRIAIVGGGIGGLCLGACLRMQGFNNFVIYEQAEAFREVGAAISCWPNALRVIDKLGAMGSLMEVSGIMKRAYIKDSTGKILQQMEMDYEYPAICLHRADLLQTLLDLIPEQALKTAHKLTSIEQDKNSVSLCFSNGEKARADVAIAADGINSRIRQLMFDGKKPVFRGYNIWRGVVNLEHDFHHSGSETWGEGARVGLVPIKNGDIGWWATCNETVDTQEDEQIAREKLMQVFGKWHSPIPKVIEKTENIIKNGIFDRPPRKGWAKGRVILLGDAAHPTTPNLGQGACMAIEGSYLLAACLACYDRPQKAAQIYEHLHFKRTRKVIRESLFNGIVGQIQNPFMRSLRNNIVSALPEKMAAKSLDKYFCYDITERRLPTA